MAANLDNRADGSAAMMYVGENGTPWHGTGRSVRKGLTSKEAIIEAGCDFEVGLLPLSIAPPIEKDKWKCASLEGLRVPRFSVYRIRKDGNQTPEDIFGDVGPQYTPLQNTEAFDFFDPFIESGEAYIDTAGSLFGGKRIWILAELNKDPIEVRPNDIVQKRILLSNSHDGLSSIKLAFVPTRVVCWNTLKMALEHKETSLVRIRHYKQAKANLDALRDVMNLANQEFEATAEQYRFLASRDINSKDLEKYVKIVLEIKEQDEDISTRSKNIMNEIIAKFEKGDKDIKDRSYWGAYNAMNFRLNWTIGRNTSNRLNSLWFGPNDLVNARALKVALEMANAV